MIANYYKRLGVHRLSSSEDIKTAYRSLARRAHPDVTEGKIADFHLLTDAYKTLITPKLRDTYDTMIVRECLSCKECKGAGYFSKQLTFTTRINRACEACGGSGCVI